MRQFKDSTEAVHVIDLNIGNVTRVKNSSDGKFDLFEPTSKIGDETLLDSVFSDLPMFWELLCYLVDPPDPAAFGKAMAADCLIAAQSAFLEEWRDFFQKLQRPQHEATLEKTTVFHEAAMKLAKAQVAKLTDGLDQRIQMKMEEAASKALGDSQARLESILAPSPSGTSG